jgi:hypothetical protein
MQQVGQRTFGWFVELRERTVRKRRQRPEQPADSFRVHDERAHVILWVGICLKVRHIVPHPLLLVLVPPDLRSRNGELPLLPLIPLVFFIVLDRGKGDGLGGVPISEGPRPLE